MIPRTRQLRVEDFPSQGEWIEPLLRALNEHMSSATGALSKQITFGENFNATLQTLTVNTRPDWITPTLDNSWAAVGAPYFDPQYRRMGDVVELRGAMDTGTVTNACFTLPVGYRPASEMWFPVDANGAYGAVSVDAAGVVTPQVGSATRFMLDGVRFQVTGSPYSPMIQNEIRFSHKLKNGKKPEGCWVVAASDITDGQKGQTVYVGASVAWSPSASEVIVTDIPGLYANRKYLVTLVVTAG